MSEEKKTTTEEKKTTKKETPNIIQALSHGTELLGLDDKASIYRYNKHNGSWNIFTK